MSDELITIAEFSTVFEAEIAKLALDNNGINSTVVGGDLVTMMMPLESVKVELKVLDVDVEKAEEIIASLGEDSEGDV